MMDLFSEASPSPRQPADSTPAPQESILVYEQPLNERIRSFLRLDFLYRQLAHFITGETQWDSRVTVSTFLDILSMLSRGDIKTELIKELERQTASLEKLRNMAGVDDGLLDRLVNQLRDYHKRLCGINGQAGASLKNNELIKSVSQRSTMPGGTGHIDLPNFHYWLEQPAMWRIDCQKNWLADLDPLLPAVRLVLNLIRDSEVPAEEVASGGVFARDLDATTAYQMIRVLVPAREKCVAEISGGKYRISVRFLEPGLAERPVPCSRDIPFRLSCCTL